MFPSFQQKKKKQGTYADMMNAPLNMCLHYGLEFSVCLFWHLDASSDGTLMCIYSKLVKSESRN